MMDIIPIGKIDGVSRLNPQDAVLFRAAFRSDCLCYANSWLYALRSTRNQVGELGFKYFHGGLLMGMGYRNQTLYLTRAYGNALAYGVANLCDQLVAEFGCQIILKKVGQRLARQLLSLGRFHPPQAEVAPGSLEDETFPEHEIFLDTLFETNIRLHPAAKNLGKKVRQYERTSNGLHAIFNPELAAEEIIKILPMLTEGSLDKRWAYEAIIRETFQFGKGTPGYLTCVFRDEQQVHGLYIGEMLGAKSMGLYCAISSKQRNGITEWMDACFLEHVHRQGVNRVLLGGSETPGVHQYVQKLMPSSPSYTMAPLIYK